MQSFIVCVAFLWTNQWIWFVCLFIICSLGTSIFVLFFSIFKKKLSVWWMLFFMKLKTDSRVSRGERKKTMFIVYSPQIKQIYRKYIKQSIWFIVPIDGFDIYYKMNKLTTPEPWIATLFFFNLYHLEMIDRYPVHNA